MKLASIERIKSISPIAGSDRIELARVLGYNTVVKKNEFKAGDLVVFHFPDTVVDAENPKYAFLAAQQFRLKVAKIRGVYSQGLVLPATDFLFDFPLVEGQDVTANVKIRKYSRPLPEGSEIMGDMPSFLRKTDEPNILSRPELCEALQGRFVYITKKLDGQSATYYVNNNTFGVCSRGRELKDTPNNPFWNIARKYNIEQIMRGWGVWGNFAIQGELYGPAIQSNRMGASEKAISFFNVWDIDGHKYKDSGALLDFTKSNALNMVEIVWTGKFDWDIAQCQEFANSLKYDNGAPCEGIVIRPVTETILDSGERLSVKVISELFSH